MRRRVAILLRRWADYLCPMDLVEAELWFRLAKLRAHDGERLR